MSNQLFQLWRRLLFYIQRDQFDRDLMEEIQFHLEQKAKENIANGMTPQEAKHATLREFGNQTLFWAVDAIFTRAIANTRQPTIRLLHIKFSIIIV